jgi:hypothetical protein
LFVAQIEVGARVTWVWNYTPGKVLAHADMDYLASEPFSGADALSNQPLSSNFSPPIFRSRARLERFRKYHCPPIDTNPIIDKTWQDIILKFVPAHRVQFFPVRLIAKGEICDDYAWVIPFDRVRCIDIHRSKITSKIETPEITLVFDAEEYAHVPGCLGGLHLARDEQQKSHMIISDGLRDALAATGESNMFYRPEDVPTLFGKNSVVSAWRM